MEYTTGKLRGLLIECENSIRYFSNRKSDIERVLKIRDNIKKRNIRNENNPKHIKY